jgi:hypothetical protein
MKIKARRNSRASSDTQCKANVEPSNTNLLDVRDCLRVKLFACATSPDLWHASQAILSLQHCRLRAYGPVRETFVTKVVPSAARATCAALFVRNALRSDPAWPATVEAHANTSKCRRLDCAFDASPPQVFVAAGYLGLCRPQACSTQANGQYAYL